jgi:hypothetical protein
MIFTGGAKKEWGIALEGLKELAALLGWWRVSSILGVTR